MSSYENPKYVKYAVYKPCKDRDEKLIKLFKNLRGPQEVLNSWVSNSPSQMAGGLTVPSTRYEQLSLVVLASPLLHSGFKRSCSSYSRHKVEICCETKNCSK